MSKVLVTFVGGSNASAPNVKEAMLLKIRLDALPRVGDKVRLPPGRSSLNPDFQVVDILHIVNVEEQEVIIAVEC